MALIRGSFASTLKTFFNGSAPLPIANGGTGSATKEAARTAPGLGVLATATTVDIANGVTGQTTAASALNALGGVGVVDSTSEEHTSELQSLLRISSTVFRLKKQN